MTALTPVLRPWRVVSLLAALGALLVRFADAEDGAWEPFLDDDAPW